MERAENGFIRHAAALDNADKSGIADKPATQHYRLHLGETGAYVGAIGGGEYVSVVAQGSFCAVSVFFKLFHPDRQLVEILLHAGMYGQLADGVLVVNFKYGIEFIGGDKPEAGLDGYVHIHNIVYVRQHIVQLTQLAQKPRALTLGGYGAGGAAEVEIDLLVAHCFQLAGSPNEMLRVVSKYLRHGIDTLVALGRYLVHIAGSKKMILSRGDKGHKVLVRAGEVFVMQQAEVAAGDTLKWGKVIFHN